MKHDKKPLLLVVIAVLVGCSPSGGSGSGSGSGSADAGPGIDAGVEDAGSLAVDGLVSAVAAATCGALTRCCDDASVNSYFSSYRNNTRLEALANRFPPAAPMDPATCPALLEEAFQLVPWGPWVEAVRAGRVGYDGTEATACLETLGRAACGDAVTQALFDGTCVGFLPPAGGSSQRRMFQRTAGEGTACNALSDGVGSALYGTCNPEVAFCCVQRAGGTGCGFPGDGAQGECTPVSPSGGECGSVPLQLCATGASCDSATESCLVEPTATLEPGEPCTTASFTLLGTCVDSWCDVLGSRACEPKRPDGEACQGASECASGACETGTCRLSTFCRGR